MMIGMLLFWVLVILGAIWLVRALLGNRPQSYSGAHLTPRQILDQRYARGEISRAEYDQILTDLSR
jgi:putative membrane protein